MSVKLQLKQRFPLHLGKSVVLRPLTTQDADSLFSCIPYNRDHLVHWFPLVSKTQTVNDSLQFLRSVEEQYRDGTALHVGIFSSEGDSIQIGCIDFMS